MKTQFCKPLLKGFGISGGPVGKRAPDWYYLFRSKIISLRIIEDGGLHVFGQDLPLNRFQAGSWTSHPTQIHEGQIFKSLSVRKKEEEVILPNFTVISPTIIRIELDNVADAVIYANENEQPDDLHCFANFPEGYERMAGLGGF
ncbi:MAG: hypothetical protein PHF79_00725 [Candidatus Pacebacteria bacterium]|nr:hypothetical protein [Candidatus Paceibacterota bacterium]